MNHWPFYAVGDGWPGDPCTWVVRLDDLFLLARVEPRGLVGLRLHCWPHSVQSALPWSKLTRIIGEMATIWGEEVENLSGLPNEWDFIFDEDFSPPPYLLLDSAQLGQWTAILQPERGLLWRVNEARPGAPLRITWDQDFGGPPPLHGESGAVASFYQKFCRESLLDEDEPCEPTQP